MLKYRALPDGDVLYFCAEKQKTRENPWKKHRNLLTNGMGCDMMVLHSVILCPNVAILIYADIVTQNMAVVKRQVNET